MTNKELRNFVKRVYDASPLNSIKRTAFNSRNHYIDVMYKQLMLMSKDQQKVWIYKQKL